MLLAALAVVAATHVVIAPSASKLKPSSPFDGLWVDDLKTQMGQTGFDDYLISNGAYRCASCTPPRSYPADGKPRPVHGDASVISESVVISGPRSIRTRVVQHDMVRTTTMTVAAGGRTATYVSLDRWPGRLTPLRTEYLAKRTAPAPAGSHPTSGLWRGVRYISVPQEYRSVRLQERSGTFARSNFRHGRYKVAIGGASAPVDDDGKSLFRATVRAPDERTRVETISLRGEPLVERTYRLSADLGSLTTTVLIRKDGSVFTTTAHRR